MKQRKVLLFLMCWVGLFLPYSFLAAAAPTDSVGATDPTASVLEIKPGFNLFKTVGNGETFIDLSSVGGPTKVSLQGNAKPLAKLNNELLTKVKDVDQAGLAAIDTVVEIKEKKGINLSKGGEVTGEIEMLALSLKSIKPIDIGFLKSFPTGTMADLYVTVGIVDSNSDSTKKLSTGKMIARYEKDNGGSFNFNLGVYPDLTFVKPGGDLNNPQDWLLTTPYTGKPINMSGDGTWHSEKGIFVIDTIVVIHISPSEVHVIILVDSVTKESVNLTRQDVLSLVALPQLSTSSTFPPAGVDETLSLGKFSIRLTQQAGQAWFGIPNCPWGNPNCLIHSRLLYDGHTKIGRSDPHQDGDVIDEINGAKICQSGTANTCNTYLPQLVKDHDFQMFPPLDGVPFDEEPSGTKEIHTQVLSLNMTDLGKCGTKSQDVVRAGLSPLLPSIGEVESLNLSLSSDFPAESFFNMFVEVDVDLGSAGVTTLYNNQPLLVQNGQLNKLPPSVLYTHDVSNTSPLVYDKQTGDTIGWIELAGHGVSEKNSDDQECDQRDQQRRSAFNTTYDQMLMKDLGLLAKGCYSILPQPELEVLGSENYEANGQQWTRYKLAITNSELLPPELFKAAPNLPPCGLNANSSRTWVDIYDSAGPRLYGFCALNSPNQLKDIWFAVPKGQTPPQCVHVELNDRQCNLKYLSNRVCDYTAGTIQFSQPEYKVNENQGRVTLWVERHGGSKGDIAVKYGTTSLTAQAGVDYQPLSGELTWQDGEMTAKPIDVAIVNDNEREADEIFYVTLLDSWGNPNTPQFNKPLHVPVTIEDDDFVKIILPPIFKPLPIFTPINVTIVINPLKLPHRMFSSSFRKTKDRDDTAQLLFDDQSLDFISSLPDTLAELNLPEFTLESDGQMSRLELPIFSAENPQIPQAWYSVWVGNPVELASQDVPVTGIITKPAEEIAYWVFEGQDGKYYQSPLYPALHPQILAALAEAFPQATLTLSAAGRIIFTQGNETSQVKVSYVVTPSGLDTEPLTVKPLNGNFLELSAHGRSQQVQLVKE
ncbi:hypothetical protein THII_0429 [Thioploca ingrica]|uniref:Calx-beta domain-containing protein n=1 Tax=Thioploca ingrica TaxID=40754 RepID=A0A090BU97_9GAMM|nr:hypothetical protein THII_0429 [Thioploca ingrica]